MVSAFPRVMAVVAASLLSVPTPGWSQQLQLDVTPAYATLKAGKKQTAWVRVQLTGFSMAPESKRAPVNVSLVLDKSGSMQGQKIARARDAAIRAIERLNAEDIVSVITYDSTVDVLVPATKLTDKESVTRLISHVEAGGSTALFAGVSKGAAEVRKFIDTDRVHRIILLSDGIANVGPSSAGELGDLGATLKRESISVSTFGLGLGYNEDLMVKLASRSGGNHFFVEEATELADIFIREFDDVMSVVAQDVHVEIMIPDGIRPVRVLGNDAEINGQQVLLNLSNIYSEQGKHVVMEVEIPATEATMKRELAAVTVSYKNMQSHAVDRLTAAVSVAFSASDSEVEESLNKSVLEDVVALLANEQNKLATDFLDKGDLVRCRQTLISNGKFLREHAEALDSERLRTYLSSNNLQAAQVGRNETNRARKSMREFQLQLDIQQKADPPAGR